MSKVLPIAIHDRPELNLRQGIKSSLNHWRQLIAASYLFYQYVQDGGDRIYSKELNTNGKVSLEVSDDFAVWLTEKYNAITNVKVLVQTCPLYLAQIEPLQVGLQLFLKLAQVEFADTSRPDSTERTGGSRYNKTLRFSTNMKILADVISCHSVNDRMSFVAQWLSGNDEDIIANQAKNVLASFTEECQFKIRTSTSEVFFQQDGIYEGLRNPNDSVESSDASEAVGPFRILKSYVKEGMHPYLQDGPDGFVVKSSATAFTSYADMVRTTLSLIPKRTTIYQEIVPVGQLYRNTVTATTFSRLDILAAIRAKPFILLAGMSGTGKTRIVRQLARGCCPAGSDLAKDPDNPGNYECIPVRPNWHDSTGLMGYVSRIDGAKYVVTDFVRFLAKAWLYEEAGIPFFLCLDEMNLAPVEQYFAEYLSAVESRRVKDGKIVTDPLVRVADEELLKVAIDVVYKGVKHETAEKFKAFFVSQGGIPIPSNFVVMGTVNMDETTCSFPHKVLDRAMTFELNEFDIDSGLESNPDTPLGSIKVENAKGTFTHGWQVYAEAKDVCDKIKPYLVSVNAVLHGTKFKFAYRTRDEVMAYCVERMKDGTALVAALDEATSMKVLSRVEGDEQIVKRTWLEKLQTAIADGLKALCAEGEEPPKKCADKLAEMHKRLVDTGFTSFWA